MKKRLSNPVIPDYTPRSERKKVEDPQARDAQKCLICPKMTLGWGMFSEGVVCSKVCNEAHMQARSLSYKEGSHVPLSS